MKNRHLSAVHRWTIIPMKTQLILALGLVVLVAAVSSGCVFALGNKVPESKPTLGKQLTDLKQARDSGAINEDEYQAAKKRLVEGK